MQKPNKALEYQLERLCDLFKIEGNSKPKLIIKNLRKNWGFYNQQKREIVIDSFIASLHGAKVLRHEFAHFLQHIKGKRFVEKQAYRFEANVHSNFPFYPPQRSLSFVQKRLEEYK